MIGIAAAVIGIPLLFALMMAVYNCGRKSGRNQVELTDHAWRGWGNEMTSLARGNQSSKPTTSNFNQQQLPKIDGKENEVVVVGSANRNEIGSFQV